MVRAVSIFSRSSAAAILSTLSLAQMVAKISFMAARYDLRRPILPSTLSPTSDALTMGKATVLKSRIHHRIAQNRERSRESCRSSPSGEMAVSAAKAAMVGMVSGCGTE